ncbi:uncharacterized protein N7482_000955 [Penicillium canariense]|uniref:Uncharacterized protein n=1 Tax=Penicillium canariense TaxID=189055 RepID=A0A9W9IE95_9EURO|nr:uncharacterized protein N7482_000955 [Penicillium canariense]KAJ5175078.1 hypothetical protein N7482_000955 [Penicillium canariense]
MAPIILTWDDEKEGFSGISITQCGYFPLPSHAGPVRDAGGRTNRISINAIRPSDSRLRLAFSHWICQAAKNDTALLGNTAYSQTPKPEPPHMTDLEPRAAADEISWIFMPREPTMSAHLSNYESDTASDERPSSEPARTKIQAIFQIARPPPKSSLRLSPKLLLQIQQLSQNHRPVPVLEVWQPPMCKSRLTREFHQRPKLRTGDIYATLDEPYMFSAPSVRKRPTEPEWQESTDYNAAIKDIVAAMCQSADKTRGSTLHFRDAQRSWQASVGTTGSENTPCYRFTINDENRDKSDPGRMMMQWERRGLAGKDENTSQSFHSDQFILVLIDRKARRKSRIATMTPGGLEIMVRKTSIMEHLQVCLDLTSPVATAASSRCDSHENLERWLFTHVLTLGIWVAQQEGWLGS